MNGYATINPPHLTAFEFDAPHIPTLQRYFLFPNVSHIGIVHFRQSYISFYENSLDHSGWSHLVCVAKCLTKCLLKFKFTAVAVRKINTPPQLTHTHNRNEKNMLHIQ